MEEEYRGLAEHLAGPEIVAAIAAVRLDSYENALYESLLLACARARRIEARAVYFEYDLDNHWDGSIFICEAYTPRNDFEEPGSDDWACDWVDDVRGPRMPDFAELYRMTSGFDRTGMDQGKTLYLVARTVAVFGRCVDRLLPPPFAICIGFHDQSPIMCIRN